MNNRPIRFDMDGVIIDSEPSHFQAFQMTFEPFGLSLSNQEYQTYFAGKTDEQGFVEFIDHLQKPFDVPALQAAKRSHYLALAETTVEPFEHAIQVIRKLADYHPLALVTSSPLLQVQTILHRFKLHTLFPVVVTAEDVSKGKPDPESYLLAADRLGYAPSDCFVVEDAPSGIAAAKRACMYCVAVTTTRPIDQLSGADTVVDHLNVEMFNGA